LSFPKRKTEDENEEWQPVSLIIAFKNEQEQLKKNLPFILEQDYPNFELVLVNDHSTDASAQYLKELDHPRIKIFELSTKTGKKAAVELGIAKSTHELLLFTDADCIPSSKHWIKRMVSPLLKGKEISLGYGKLRRGQGLLVLLQRYENCMNSLQNFSFANRSRAYMAVGRNLAYKKVVYSKSTAFDSYSSIKGGDDDLIVNEMSKDQNTAVVIDQDAHTISEASTKWKQYYHQKRRHLEAGKHYKKKDRSWLAILGLSQLIFNLLFITLLLTHDKHLLIIGIFVLKVLLQLVSYRGPMKQLEELDWWWITPVLEMIYLPIISYIGLSQYLWKVDRWK